MDILSARKKAAERAKKKGARQKPEEIAPPARPEEGVLPPAPPAPDAPAQTEAAVPPAEKPAPEPVSAPGEEAAEPGAEVLEMLSFRLGGEEYVIMVEQVREVLKLRETTPVPHAPAYVLGVISLRGAVLPVIDLGRRLGLAGGVRDEKSRIIVVGIGEEEAGLIVDRVTGVVRFPPEAVKPAPETIEQGAGAEYLKGIARKEEKLYILLDLEKAVGA